MIFVVVGNWPNGFDRLVRTVDRLKQRDVVQERVLVQLGGGSYLPKHAEYFRYCDSDEFNGCLRNSRMIIAHAGVGVMTSGVRAGKPVIVLPRRAELGEHYDNHQLETASQFELLGYVMVAHQEADIAMKIQLADSFVPEPLEPSADLLETIRAYLADLSANKMHSK